jgi:ubiquinone/menaquinone biosynthesis C-methylase UbiE
MKAHQSENTPVTREAAAGAAVYSKFTLFFYDALVMLFENRFVWKCPTRAFIDFYNRHVSNNHLDVGVGTGYFLDRCAFPGGSPVIHLMDLNLNCLERTSRRIKRYDPVIHQWNVLAPVAFDLPLFDSICISNILHCLPGDFKSKEIAFTNLKRYLNKGGVLFGSTILGKDVSAGFLYKIFNGIYNRWLVFSNLQDDIKSLNEILAGNFNDYSVELKGSIAFFCCRNMKN